MDFSNILQDITTVITGLLAGSMLFFSFVMAPLIFIKLEIREAGKFVRAVFPWYYLVVIALSGARRYSFSRYRPPKCFSPISGNYFSDLLPPELNAKHK